MMSIKHLALTGCLAAFGAAGSAFGGGIGPKATKPAGPTLFGITRFPYDFTAAAVVKSQQIADSASTMLPIHLDDGVPWNQLLAREALPPAMQANWHGIAASIPAGRPVYVGLACLASDRVHLADGTDGHKHLPLPAALASAPLDSPLIEHAWLIYAQRVISAFHPRWLNLGIEAGEGLLATPARWRQFQRLYFWVRAALKRSDPTVSTGISFGLNWLRVPAYAELARPLVNNSDFLGLSFYPSASAFDARFGLPVGGPGAAAWTTPLKSVRTWAHKPIAICETGYASRGCTVPQYHLHLTGNPSLQAAYVCDLFHLARQNHYLFVVWFLTVDYDALYRHLPAGLDAMKIWRNMGMFDAALKPKPAWSAWKRGISQQ